MSAPTHPSPNFDDRRDGARPSYIILHYTGMKTAAEALARLCDPAARVSAHYTVDEDGALYSHVAEGARAWHAGQSYWRGISDMNSHSIGIEIVNPGHEFSYRDFPQTQIRAVADLCRDVMARHGIPPENVLGHSDIAPARKQDPGELFPWEKLAEQGVGIWPSTDKEANLLMAILDVDQTLLNFGYDPNATPRERLIAFQRHYEPRRFALGLAGEQSPDTQKIITKLCHCHWLIPQRGV